MTNKVALTSGLIMVLFALGTTDALLTKVPSQETENEMGTVIQEPRTNNQEPTDTQTGVKKQQGPNVLDALINHSFTFQNAMEESLISQIVPTETPVTSYVILLNNDRAGQLSWVESPSVKVYFLALKEALHSAFTPHIVDLLDETQRRPGKPIRNFLTFLDPGLSTERYVFVRVRDRLYELSIADERKDAVYELIEGLTE